MKTHNPSSIYPPLSSYSHALEVAPNARWLLVSGQVGVAPDGKVPKGFREQCELAWSNLDEVLKSGGMGIGHLAKITIYLIREQDLQVFREIRDRYLDGHRPASTLLFISALARPDWLIEIEAVAAQSQRDELDG